VLGANTVVVQGGTHPMCANSSTAQSEMRIILSPGTILALCTVMTKPALVDGSLLQP
jgi:hypothetical protein